MPRMVVLDIEVNNLTHQSLDSAEGPRVGRLTLELRKALAEPCGYRVTAIDSAAAREVNVGEGYFYAHPEVAARLAASAGAEWVIIPRLNRVSPWVADLQAHVVRVASGEIISNRVVAIRGFGLQEELTARLTVRAAAWMADQIDQAIGYASEGGPAARHCKATEASP